MPAEVWTGIITGVVIPVLLRILMHYMPWLADDPELRARTKVDRTRQTPAPQDQEEES